MSTTVSNLRKSKVESEGYGQQTAKRQRHLSTAASWQEGLGGWVGAHRDGRYCLIWMPTPVNASSLLGEETMTGVLASDSAGLPVSCLLGACEGL